MEVVGERKQKKNRIVVHSDEGKHELEEHALDTEIHDVISQRAEAGQRDEEQTGRRRHRADAQYAVVPQGEAVRTKRDRCCT